MGKFLYGILLQWKLDLRNKGIIITYYIVPLVFFIFMGGIFTSIDPLAYKTLIPSMTVFGVTMGAMLGAPTPLVEVFGTEIKKGYRASGIPLWTVVVNNFISGFINLFIMSLIIFFIAPIAFEAVVPKNIFIYFSILALFIASSLSVATVLGLAIKSASKLTMISQFIFLPSVMLSGIMFPAEMLPKALQSIGKILPATWGFEGLIKTKVEIATILPLVVIFVAFTIIGLWEINKSKVD